MSEHVAELLKPARTPLMSLMGCDIRVINPEWMPHTLNVPRIVISIDICINSMPQIVAQWGG